MLYDYQCWSLLQLLVSGWEQPDSAVKHRGEISALNSEIAKIWKQYEGRYGETEGTEPRILRALKIARNVDEKKPDGEIFCVWRMEVNLIMYNFDGRAESCCRQVQCYKITRVELALSVYRWGAVMFTPSVCTCRCEIVMMEGILSSKRFMRRQQIFKCHFQILQELLMFYHET